MKQSRAVLVVVGLVVLGVLGFTWRASTAGEGSSPAPVRGPELHGAGATPAVPDSGRESVGREAAPLAGSGDAGLGVSEPGHRLRGQVEVASGLTFPARFEVLIEVPGAPAKVVAFDGPETVVSLDVPPGRAVLSARAEGLASRPLVLDRSPEQATPPFRLVLEPAGRLTGQVLDVRGAGLEGLSVWLVPVNTREVRQTATGSEGRFSFSDVPVGSYRLAWGSADSSIAPVVPVEVVQHEVRDVPPQTMPELSEAEIRVTDRAAQIVPGARVYGAGQNGGWIDGVSDSMGLVRARFLPPGLYFLNVEAEPKLSGQGQLVVQAGRIGRAVIQVRE